MATKGYSIGTYYWLPKNQRINIGFLIVGSEQVGSSKNLITENGENLDKIRNTWVAGVRIRYFFNEKARGFYININFGYEQFDFTFKNQKGSINNFFATPFLRYTWFLNGKKGIFIQPAIGAILIFDQTNPIDKTNK